ncbi:hypothetical protein F4804DRAFT_339192 [Jackrogersella minutella]|nr:hypothetical protein F4804DRAFT_339192 [Jackrogersella minutella]
MRKGQVVATDELGREYRRWLFEEILDSRKNGRSLEYKMQPTKDLKGCENWLLEFHDNNPDKPRPPSWFKKSKARKLQKWEARHDSDPGDEKSDSNKDTSDGSYDSWYEGILT